MEEECTLDHMEIVVLNLVTAQCGWYSTGSFCYHIKCNCVGGHHNGLIFYANIVKMYKHIFFPDSPITILSQFISWLNLDLGIEACFITVCILVVRHGYNLSFQPTLVFF